MDVNFFFTAVIATSASRGQEVGMCAGIGAGISALCLTLGLLLGAALGTWLGTWLVTKTRKPEPERDTKMRKPEPERDAGGMEDKVNPGYLDTHSMS